MSLHTFSGQRLKFPVTLSLSCHPYACRSSDFDMASVHLLLQSVVHLNEEIYWEREAITTSSENVSATRRISDI